MARAMAIPPRFAHLRLFDDAPNDYDAHQSPLTPP